MVKIALFAPHCDDAALSAGSWLAARPSWARASIVSVFTASPYSSAGKGRLADISLTRKREELSYAASVGAECRFLDFPDIVLSQRRLFAGAREPREDCRKELLETVEELLRDLAPDFCLFPLGAGCHIDHIALSETGRRLKLQGLAAGFYEDLPYAAGCSRSGLKALARRCGARHRLTTAAHTALKARSIKRHYPSQEESGTDGKLLAHQSRFGGEGLWVDPACAREGVLRAFGPGAAERRT